MKEPNADFARDVALFRYGAIAELLLLYFTIFRRACLTLGRRDATARKKESGTGNDGHRCRKVCLDSKIGVVVLLCISLCKRRCVKNGSTVCQAQCGPDRTKQSELPQLRLPPGSPERAEVLRAKARHDFAIPGSRGTRLAAQTLRDWLRLCDRGGFDALFPKPRADRGRARRLPPEAAELLTALKESHPEWAVCTVIRQARASGQLPPDTHLAPSTVYRLLKRSGLLDRAAFEFHEIQPTEAIAYAVPDQRHWAAALAEWRGATESAITA